MSEGPRASATPRAVAPVTLRPAQRSDAAALGALMTTAISWGRLGDLGSGFVRLVHRHMVTSRFGVVMVAEIEGVPVGYIGAATDTRRYYRDFVWRHGIEAAIRLLPNLWSPKRLATIRRGTTHFAGATREDPVAELLSFAVRPGSEAQGIGTALFGAMVHALKLRGVRAMKLATVDAANEVGNAFYQKQGCLLVRTEPFYDDRQVNVYVYNIDGAA